MRRSDLVRNAAKGKTVRTSQIVFGERQHLLRVLDSVERSALPAPRMEQERRVIEQLIHARTQELNRINAGWDEKIGVVLSAEVRPDTLDSLTKQAPKEDYYLLRLISEHPKVSAKTLGASLASSLLRHPRKYRPPSKQRRGHAHSPQPGPHAAVMVSRRVQSQRPVHPAQEAAGAHAPPRRKIRHAISQAISIGHGIPQFLPGKWHFVPPASCWRF